MLVASRVNGNWHSTFCSSYMASFRRVPTKGVDWCWMGPRGSDLDWFYSHLADAPEKVKMQPVWLVRLGCTQQKCHSRRSQNDCAPRSWSYQYSESNPVLWFFAIKTFTSLARALERCNGNVTDATRLLENHLTDAISFNSAISACEKRLDQRDGQPVWQDVMEM